MKSPQFMLMAFATLMAVPAFAADFNPEPTVYIRTHAINQETGNMDLSEKPAHAIRAEFESEHVLTITLDSGRYNIEFPSNRTARDFRDALATNPEGFHVAIDPDTRVYGRLEGVLPFESLWVTTKSGLNGGVDYFIDQVEKKQKRDAELATGNYSGDLFHIDQLMDKFFNRGVYADSRSSTNRDSGKTPASTATVSGVQRAPAIVTGAAN